MEAMNAGVYERKEPKPFKLRLVRHLGLSGVTYAPEYTQPPGEYLEPVMERKFQQHLAALALQTAQEGGIDGSLGLEYAESDLFLDSVNLRRNRTVYHGSPHKLSTVQPRQPTWHAKDATNHTALLMVRRQSAHRALRSSRPCEHLYMKTIRK